MSKTLPSSSGLPWCSVAQDESLFLQHGGHIDWHTQILGQFFPIEKYVRKCSSAGRVSIPHFRELEDKFLLDIQAITNENPEVILINWDQTALVFMATGQWTMNCAREQIVTITNSDDSKNILWTCMVYTDIRLYNLSYGHGQWVEAKSLKARRFSLIRCWTLQCSGEFDSTSSQWCGISNCKYTTICDTKLLWAFFHVDVHAYISCE